METFALIILFLLSSTTSVPCQNNYESANVEKVYLHTDRNIYMAGDYLFFELYLKSNLSQESQYAYMVIRNQNNKVIIYNRIDIINKISYGSIILPDTLSTGYYQIVCFTNLMRNYEDSFFTKEIVIANRFDEKLNDNTNLARKDELVTARNKSFTQKAIEDNLAINLEKQTFAPRERISFTVLFLFVR